MSAASDYLENAFYNCLLRGVPLTPPVKVYVALHTSDPGDTGANEVQLTDFPAYARKDAANGGSVESGWTAPTGGSGKNAQQLIFPVYNGSAPITITHYSLWDAATGGNCLVCSQLASNRTLNIGDVFVVDVQKLTVAVL
ncbi:hypothetical protein D3C76_48040 [compost metagenome]